MDEGAGRRKRRPAFSRKEPMMNEMRTRGMADEGRKKDMMGRITDEPSSSGGVMFSPPSGAKLNGNSGTATVSWKRSGDGQIQITAINGASIGGDSEENPAEQSKESPEDEFDEYD